MARRGIADPEALAAFLGPAIAGLNDPRLLPDAGRWSRGSLEPARPESG